MQAAVEAVFERPAEQGVSLAMVVLVDGELVAERYGVQPANIFEPDKPLGPDSPLLSWSMAKSVTHAAVGLLVGDGLLDPEAPAPVPEWLGTDKAEIRLIDLLEMRSGLHWIEEYVDDTVDNCLEMLFGAASADMAAYAAALPLEHAPGTVWNYSSGTTNIVSRIVGDIVAGGPGGHPERRRAAIDEFLRARLFEPVGMTSADPRFDEAGTFIGSSYLYATARDFARFGELYRHDGCLPDGTRLLPRGWADHARTFVSHDPDNGSDYGRHWYMWPKFPGSLAAHGFEGQYTLVVPDRRLTLVHLGKTGSDVRGPLLELLHAVVLTA